MRPVLILCLATALSAQDPGTTYHLRIDQALTPSQHRLLHARFGADCSQSMTGRVELYVHPDELSELTRLGFRTIVLGRGRPYAEVVQARANTQLNPDTNYFTPDEIVTELDRFAKLYPKLARRVDVTAMTNTTKTHDGRSIFALKISDNVTLDEDEPAILVASQHHARELNTPVIVMGAIDRILKGYATSSALKALVDGSEIYCVPCVNPDGVHRVWTKDRWWRKNGRGSYGVDLNRNYPFLWGRCGASTSKSSQTYRGPAAASEPETKTMMALQRLLRPEIYLDFHSSGREVLTTYAPCATVDSVIQGMIVRYADDLRGPMTYAVRAPSASGEAPEWHWADGGTLSYLTEISTSFQPSYASALSEAARVWPGIQRAATRWRPALRGHVRSIYRDEPIAATIRFTPGRFSHGEQAASRARDGRYGLWLPLGTHRVTFSAPGFVSVTKTVRVSSYDSPQALEIHMVPSMASATIVKSGTDRLGSQTTLTYRSPSDAGEIYWVLFSLGTSPGIPIGADRVVPLNADIAMHASIRSGVLVNGFGQLSSTGIGVARFSIPNVLAFVGLRLYAGGVTENASYLSSIKNFSPATSLTILR